jgi:carboxyl-terminal processing protease
LAFAQDGAYRHVLESSLWKSYVKTFEANYKGVVDLDLLNQGCEKHLTGTKLKLQDAIDLCITNTLEATDRFGSYENARTFAYRKSSGPPFVGIGLELLNGKTAGESLRVVTPIANGPAARAGVRAGDEILAVDGKSLVPLDMYESIAALRGSAGSQSSLLIRRGGEIVTLTAVRQEIRANYVRTRRFPDDVLYSRVSFFRENSTGTQFQAQMKEAAQGSVTKALILDLRNCPGGSLDEIMSLASLFTEPETELLKRVSRSHQEILASGAAVASTDNQSRETYELLKKVPLYVLVNKGTSNGAEALAIALRQSRKAIVVGSRTAGLNFIQRQLPLDDRVAINVTTGRLLTATGDDWTDRGVPIDFSAPESAGHEFGDRPEDAALAAVLKKIMER